MLYLIKMAKTIDISKQVVSNKMDVSKQVYEDYSKKVVKNIVGDKELELPFNKKAGILHREVP